MSHVSIHYIGIVVILLIIVGLSDMPRHWLSPKITVTNDTVTMGTDDGRPIPSFSIAPRIVIPQWSLYVGSFLCLLVAAVMLRFHLPQEIRWFRRPPP